MNYTGRRATGVSFYDPGGRSRQEQADAVVLAGSSIETIRLALLSRLPDGHALIGRRAMFHWFTEAIGVFLDERLHPYRNRGPIDRVDDFADPDFPGARAAAAAAGLPYIRGGVLELGGSQDPIGEGMSYTTVLSLTTPVTVCSAANALVVHSAAMIALPNTTFISPPPESLSLSLLHPMTGHRL